MAVGIVGSAAAGAVRIVRAVTIVVVGPERIAIALLLLVVLVWLVLLVATVLHASGNAFLLGGKVVPVSVASSVSKRLASSAVRIIVPSLGMSMTSSRLKEEGTHF